VSSKGSNIRVALIGCGQIADAHLGEIRRIAGAEAVAVCDRHIDLARQAAARFDVAAAYNSVDEMLRRERPDVVHIATPPHSHATLAIQCLDAGAHVYVDKPFCVDPREADTIIAAADNGGLSVCLGHDQLFDPAWMECRALVTSGALGHVVHIDAIQGYDLDGPFGRLLAADPTHWVHRLPGGLFQNVMSHAMARITDFLPDDRPIVQARWFATRTSFPTELRATLIGQHTTGTLIFTSEARPSQKIARIYGTKMAVDVDLDARTVRRYRPPTAPAVLAKVQLPWWQLKDAARNLRNNVGRLRRSDLHFFQGMNTMFRAFYQSIQDGSAPPVTHAEARRVTTIMDMVFAECSRADEQVAPPRLVAAGGTR
jgi:predicted dehydrogenase